MKPLLETEGVFLYLDVKQRGMDFRTIYSSPNSSEISIIKNLFHERGISYKVLDEVTSGVIAGAGVTGTRVQVKAEDSKRAKKILVESGFLEDKDYTPEANDKPAVNKWVLILLASLVLVMVALLVMWFMSAS